MAIFVYFIRQNELYNSKTTNNTSTIEWRNETERIERKQEKQAEQAAISRVNIGKCTPMAEETDQKFGLQCVNVGLNGA